ncbi:MAG: carbohydrate ABC transporter permease [Gorillibacterium sp.]|nr:carbohydrate ABC transporter permease [Gorillibacterium sp.]
MMLKLSMGRRIFLTCNYLFLITLSLLCLLPFVNAVAISFSESSAVIAGKVTIWPVDFTLSSYKYILNSHIFIQTFSNTIVRVVLGTSLSMLMTCLLGYALSKETSAFRFRTVYVWIFVITILFNGGLIPWYMTIKMVGILDTIWALILPGAVQVFNVILLLNFFRALPKELEESSFIDGAGHWTTLLKIYLPISMPALATILLLTMVGHWNAWFDGLILMNKVEHYPLSSYLQTVVIQMDFSHLNQKDVQLLGVISNRTSKAAQIVLGALPILLVYPFLQRYFVKGLTIGSVKG